MSILKVVIFIYSLVLANASFAIVTADCPKEFSVTIADFKPVTLPDYLLSYRYPEDAVQAHSELTTMPKVIDTYTLNNTRSSTCSYKSVNTGGATITGSLKPNATKKAHILMWWNYETQSKEYRKKHNPDGSIGLQTYIPIKGLSQTTIDLSFPNGYASLYNINQMCGYGDCGMKLVRIGKVNKITVNVK